MTNNYDDEFQFNGIFPSADDYILSEDSFKREDVFEPSYNPDVPYKEAERKRNEINRHLVRPEVILLRAPWGISKTTLMIRNYWWREYNSALISQSYEHLETHLKKNGVLKHKNVIIVKGLDKLCRIAQKQPDRVDILRNNGVLEFKIEYAVLVVKLNPECFFNLIERGEIVINLRMHLKETGVARNHGTAFRTNNWDLLRSCYEDSYRLI